MSAKQILKMRQANAAKARAALRRKRMAAKAAPIITEVLTPSENAPEWAVGVKDLSFAVFINDKIVFAHDFNQKQEA